MRGAPVMLPYTPSRRCKMERPDFVTDEHLEYLDELRESGETNMWGAGAWVQEEFELSKEITGKILSYWMKTFGKESR